MADVLVAPDFRVRHDRDSDVVYITTRPGVRARSREEEPGLVWRYDAESGALIGVTIVDFATYWAPRRARLAAQIGSRFGMAAKEAGRLLDDVG